MKSMSKVKMKVLIICSVLLWFGQAVVIDRSRDLHPVYKPLEENEVSTTEDYMEVVVGTKYEVRTEMSEEKDNATDGLLISLYEKCLKSNGMMDCLKFKTYNFLKVLLQPIAPQNLSTAVAALNDENGGTLVRLPLQNVQPLLSRTMQRAFGSSDIVNFLTQLLDDFISRYGLAFTVKREAQLDSPWLIGPEDKSEWRSGRKVKKKDMHIVFPLLVLFKFLKIKMMLVPILLGVMFLKKLLILTLTLLPYLIGLFGFCRRPPLFGTLQSSGIVQELDTRGEFSSNLGYAIPFRDGYSYKQKDKRAPDLYGDY